MASVLFSSTIKGETCYKFSYEFYKFTYQHRLIKAELLRVEFFSPFDF